ncbi:MAG TPA: hypothetical protein VIW29_08880 [Polyangiaceae bacterium]
MSISGTAHVAGGPRSASRPPAAPAPAAAAPAAPPIRLRFVLLLALGAFVLLSGYPRLQAAFGLHDGAVATADYALCMVGPTGPAQLRDRPAEFSRLVRRRLVASAPAERPFHRCAKLAQKITGSVDVERLHNLPASEFREYAGKGTSLTQLAVSAAPLGELASAAWPFARGGYTQLMKSSLGATEAAHVPPPARPALGKGLPLRAGVYRNVWRDGSAFGVALGAGEGTTLLVTHDRGLSFRPLAQRGAALDEHAERCESQDRHRVYRLTPREDGSAQQILFSLDAQTPITSDLAPMTERVLGSGCDDKSLAALTADRERLRLRVCPFAGRCGELLLPAPFASAPASAVDLAKVKGTIVLSLVQEGVVRVISSRDEGRTFTPAVVAFDAAEYPELGAARRLPSRLLGLGERLLLYGGAGKPGEAYPLLASDDQGVSFRTP